MWNYPVHLEPAEEGGFVVTFPDVPEAITQGTTVQITLPDARAREVAGRTTWSAVAGEVRQATRQARAWASARNR
jgi:hypothetical protein